jgi:hypothetical protein
MSSKTAKRFEKAFRQNSDLTSMASAMPLAAIITLGHRLPMLFSMASGPNAGQMREATKMVAEKISAAGDVASALGDAALASQQAIADYVVEQSSANLAFATVPPLHPRDWYGFGGAAFDRLATLSDKLGDIASAGAKQGLHPTHKTVVANAKRLTRKAAKKR